MAAKELTEWRQTPSIGANKSSETLQTKDAAVIGTHLACWCELKDFCSRSRFIREITVGLLKLKPSKYERPPRALLAWPESSQLHKVKQSLSEGRGFALRANGARTALITHPALPKITALVLIPAKTNSLHGKARMTVDACTRT